MEIQTERLLLRPPRPADLDDLLELHADPVVEGVFGPMSRAETSEWIAATEREWAERAHGRAVVLGRQSGAFLGRSGLRYWPQFDEVEVGWTFGAPGRGRGFATEAGRASLDWGFRELDLPYITALINPANAASIAVAERLGMEPLRDDVLFEEPVTVYALRR